MSPHLPQFDREILFRLIRRNVIPRDELELLDEQYDRLFAAKQGGGEPVACHVFASMFKIGLLGYVGMHPETAELVQYFRYPGEVPLDRNDVLPDAEQFLVHPSLDLLIGSYNPDYFRHLDKLNVIGADRPWRAGAPDPVRAQGRRARRRRHLPGPGRRRQLPGASSPRRWPRPAATSRVARAIDGDAALLVDPNPRQVVMAALALRQRLLHSAYGCDIRFGGDAGFVEIAGEGPGAQARAGLALLVAARLEPHAPPGAILVTGQFVDAWRDLLGAGGLQRAAGRAAARCRCCARATAASISPSPAARRRCCGGCWCSTGRTQSAIPAISRTHDLPSYRVLYIQVQYGASAGGSARPSAPRPFAA